MRGLFEAVIAEAQKRPTIVKLDAAARELTGFGLSLVVPAENATFPICPATADADLPDFCRLVHATPDGKYLCDTCRSLACFGACSRDVSEHHCTGGITVIAACICKAGVPGVGSATVCSADFTQGNLAEGWRAAKAQLRKLPLDFKALKDAYYRLPRLSVEKQAVLRLVVAVAATAIAEITQELAARTAVPRRPTAEIEKQVRADLVSARAPCNRKATVPVTRILIESVISVVNRYPGMRFNVADLARAAHMTPNYFSMLFRRHTGHTFVRYLMDKRIALAKKLLRTTRDDIKEVSDHAGFDDPGYFARQFKKITRRTPREWRERA